MDENEFLLEDRIVKIKSISKENRFFERAYVSFSGGKDSTVLHRLVDIALPGNRLPRVFINTGIEYRAVVEFVLKLAEKDERFVIIRPGKNIRDVLKEHGYPFKSKEHSCKLAMFQKGSTSESVKKYWKGRGQFTCPDVLRYQFNKDFGLKISDRCCTELKKKPVHEWERLTGRDLCILGVRMKEGGQRGNHSGCVVLDGSGHTKKFKPLNVVGDEWLEWFIRRYKVELCKLYGEPFNFKRTGCKGCPFSVDLQRQLRVMSYYLPSEKRQCEIIWKPIYEEYRRIGYRLGEKELFD